MADGNEKAFLKRLNSSTRTSWWLGTNGERGALEQDKNVIFQGHGGVLYPPFIINNIAIEAFHALLQ